MADQLSDHNIENNGSNSSGIFLTWEDLWVTVSKGKKSILQGLTGYARPGQLLAVMGPSGSGKSTLLDSLAGRLETDTIQKGSLLVNGREQALAYGTLAYVMQDEALTVTLTVKETLYYSASLQLPNSMTKLEKKQRAEKVIAEMGLREAMNTRIGGWGVRGLSGGQKRRLSICIEILGHPELLFLDEPTSGLDSAASYYVMTSIARQKEGKTIIATIHQPSAEVFDLFDNVCLLSSGRTVFFGSIYAVKEFFASNGFPCPSLQNPSDHFLKTINKDFDEDIELGLSKRKPTEEVINTLTDAYNSSEEYNEVLIQVAEIRKQEGTRLQNRRRAAFTTQCSVLTRRSLLNMSRDFGYYWLRLAMLSVLGLGIGTIFFEVGSSYGSILARGSMLMYISSFFLFMTVGGLPSFLEDMKVFQRERSNGHYGPSVFVVSHSTSSIPFLLLISSFPGAIAYFLTGLQSEVEQYVYFTLMVFAGMLLVESIMMVVANVVPNFLMGLLIVSGIQGMMMLGGGFFRLPNDLPKPFWKYPMYYIAFHKYEYQGLYKNEFAGLTFPDVRFENSSDHRLNGEDILRDIWQVEMGYSKWVDLCVILGMVVLYRVMFIISVKINEYLQFPMAKTSRKSWIGRKRNYIPTNLDVEP